MGSLFGEICHIFCCPPRPSHIVAKFAFLPPSPTYTIVQSQNGDERQIIFKPEAGHISDYAKSRMEVFYSVTKRNSRIACLYIHYDPVSARHSLSTSMGCAHGSTTDRITILFSHGNAVDIGQMAGFLCSLSQRFGVNILVYDYSGYGASTGQTLEANLYADAEAALAELRERYFCPLNRIVLYGQSIGTAPTVELATHYAVAGVILHSALMSGLRVVCPGTTRRFCFDPFNSIDKVEHIQSPTLVIHGTDDHVIGLHHGKELFARLPNPLEPLWVDGADHNDIELFYEYTVRLEKFFQEDMRQTTTATPPPPRFSSEHHPGRNTAEGDRNRSPICGQNTLATVEEHHQQLKSWDSAASSSSLNAPARTATSTTSRDLPETNNSTPPPASSTKLKTLHASFIKSRSRPKTAASGAAGHTSSSISLPLDTSGESIKCPSDHGKAAEENRHSSGWLFQSVKGRCSSTAANSDNENS